MHKFKGFSSAEKAFLQTGKKKMGASCLREAAENVNKLRYLAIETERSQYLPSITVGMGMRCLWPERRGRALAAWQGCWSALWGAEPPEQLRSAPQPAPEWKFPRGPERGQQVALRSSPREALQHSDSIPESRLHQLPALPGLRVLTDHRLLLLSFSTPPVFSPAPPSPTSPLDEKCISMSGKEKQECTKICLILRLLPSPLSASPSPLFCDSSPHTFLNLPPHQLSLFLSGQPCTKGSLPQHEFSPSQRQSIPCFSAWFEDVTYQFSLLFFTHRKNHTCL